MQREYRHLTAIAPDASAFLRPAQATERNVGATLVVAFLADAARKPGRPQGSPLHVLGKSDQIISTSPNWRSTVATRPKIVTATLRRERVSSNPPTTSLKYANEPSPTRPIPHPHSPQSYPTHTPIPTPTLLSHPTCH